MDRSALRGAIRRFRGNGSRKLENKGRSVEEGKQNEKGLFSSTYRSRESRRDAISKDRIGRELLLILLAHHNAEGTRFATLFVGPIKNFKLATIIALSLAPKALISDYIRE